MQQPSHEDANLILRLYELRREERMRQARSFLGTFHADNLEEYARQCPPGSPEEASFRMVMSYWEMVASFLTSDVLNKELFFQSGNELLYAWEKIRTMLGEYRRVMGGERSFSNLETVAREYIAFHERNSPGSYAAFSERVRSRAQTAKNNANG